MALEFRPVDRNQLFLLPPSLREWLPDDHLAWFVVDVVGQLDTSAFRRRPCGEDSRGRQAFDPDMLLCLLIYAYATGVRSSRQIARLCEVDVAFRLLCAQDPPSHQTLSRFVASTEEAVAGLFGQVLLLCAELGLVRLGTVAIDGTKIAASASRDRNRDRDGLQKAAAKLVSEHRATDNAEDTEFGNARGDELPAELCSSSRRATALQQAVKELDRRAEQRNQDDPTRRRREQQRTRRTADTEPTSNSGRCVDEQRVPVAQRRLAEARRKAEQAYARTSSGPQWKQAVPPERHCRVREAEKTLVRAQQAETKRTAERKARIDQDSENDQVNVTDPDSRLLKTRNGWVQGFNCQLGVSADQIIVAATASQQPADTTCFEPILQQAVTAVAVLPDRPDAQIGTVLADAGYFSEHNLTCDGPDRLIAPGSRRNMTSSTEVTGPTGTPAMRAMRQRLKTEDGKTCYAARGSTVEAVNGQLKDRVGLRQFRRRGLDAVQAELLF
ncbi:MAG TPA: transposase, partial [Frankiaceae bacterium]|nr:transposase [Frankiaceae bacterium]